MEDRSIVASDSISYSQQNIRRHSIFLLYFNCVLHILFMSHTIIKG